MAITTTNSHGFYDFKGLRPGVYQVAEINTISTPSGPWFAEASSPGFFEPQYGGSAGATVPTGFQLEPNIIAGITTNTPGDVITDTEGVQYDFLNIPI